MIFYTDGSAHPNPGPGGFGVVVLNEDGEYLTCYREDFANTTNNAMEMRAIIWACLYAKLKNEKNVTIYSDSAYAINTFTNWMFGWERNGWIKGDGKVPENLDLVSAFFQLNKELNITFQKVRGHQGNKYNELADKLATGAKICNGI